MKILQAMTLGLVMSTVALPALANKATRQQLADCKTELRAMYGEETHVRLRSISKRRIMRIWTVPPEGDSLLVHCSKNAAGKLNLMDGEGLTLVNPNRDSINKVSSNQ